MSTATDWIKKIDAGLLSLDEKPQFGNTQEFPLKAVQDVIQKLFGQKNLNLQIQHRGWLDAKHLWEGLGEHLLYLTVDMTPLEPSIFFVMSQQDLKELMGEFLQIEPSLAAFHDLAIAEGFYHYLALEMMQAIESVGFGAPLSPRLADSPKDLRAHLGTKACFAIDVGCQLEHKTIWGRLLISADFRRSWKQYFAQHSTALQLNPKLPVEIGVQIATSMLAIHELKHIGLGDVIILDRCTLEVGAEDGFATVLLGQQPLFRAKLKKQAIELLEFPFEEIGATMDQEDELNEEVEEILSSEQQATQHPDSSNTVTMDASNLPICLTVEVARLKMTLQELSQLSAGNIIEIQDRAEASVTLLANGKKIGQGELVQVGEAVGVRVTSI